MPLIQVGNVRTYRGDMRNAAYCGRPSPYGNPFIVGSHGDRKLSIARFRAYWYAPENELLRQQAARELLHKEWLLCWCKPADCHVDVIAEYLNNEIARMLPRT